MYNIDEIKKRAAEASYSIAIFDAATGQSERPVREVVAELADMFCLATQHDDDSRCWIMNDDEETVIEIEANGDLIMTNCDTRDFINYKPVPSSSIDYSAAQ